jgi:hypothetical protein
VRGKEARDVKNRIKVAIRLRDEVYTPERKKACAYYEGDHWGDSASPPVDLVTVNYLYPIVETKVSAIAFRHPDFTLVPMNEREKENEASVRGLLSYTFRKGRFLYECRRAFRDYQIGGVGVALLGWKQSWGKVGENATTTMVGRTPLPGEASDPTENSVPARDPITDPMRDDRPFVKRISPQNFFIAPESDSDWNEAAYLGYTELLPVGKVRRHPHWKNTSKLKGSTENLRDLFDDELRLEEKNSTTSPDLLRVKIHHYFDRDRLTYVVMAEEGDDPLYEADWPYPFIDRYPFRILRADDNEDRFWPKPTLMRYAHPQREINQSRSILARHQRQSVRKLQYRGRLTPSSKKQLASDGSLGIVELEGQERIEEVPHAHVQPEIFRSEEAAKGDLQLLAAMNAYESFDNPTYRKTQAEAQAIAAAGGARAKAEQEAFEAFVSGIGQDTLSFLQEYSVWSGLKTVPMFEGGKHTAFRHFTLDEIRGDFWVSVYVGSTMVPNRTALAEQIGLIMQSAPNLVQGVMLAEQAGMDFRLLLRAILEGIPEIRDASKIVPDKPEGGGDVMGMLSQLPPEMMQGMLGPMQGGPQGQAEPTPFPQSRPDGSLDIAQLDQYLRALSDEDLAGYLNGG